MTKRCFKISKAEIVEKSLCFFVIAVKSIINHKSMWTSCVGGMEGWGNPSNPSGVYGLVSVARGSQEDVRTGVPVAPLLGLPVLIVVQEHLISRHRLTLFGEPDGLVDFRLLSWGTENFDLETCYVLIKEFNKATRQGLNC